jgi:hypothetical protein
LPLINQYLAQCSDEVVNQIIANIGRERLTQYLQSTLDDRSALALYQVNGQLSKHIHELIGGFEIALRNSISQSLSGHYQRDDWYRARNFVMQLAQERRQNIREVRNRLKMDRREERPGRIIAGLTFHFWVSMHENKYRDITWTPHLHKIWPRGESLKVIHKDLLKVRDLRNRIAHHEPIFNLNWRIRIDIIWSRFEHVSPKKKAWFHERLSRKINPLLEICDENEQ